MNGIEPVKTASHTAVPTDSEFERFVKLVRGNSLQILASFGFVLALSYFLPFSLALLALCLWSCAVGGCLSIYFFQPASLSPNCDVESQPVVSTAQSASTNSESDTADELAVFIPELVDNAFVEFVNAALKTYFYTWYSEITHDEAFVDEVLSHLRCILAHLVVRVRDVDLTALLLKTLTPVAANHLSNYLEVRSQFPLTVVEQQSLDNYRQFLHKAVISRDCELTYLRNLSKVLVRTFLPEEPRRSAAVVALLEELLTFCVLLPTMDLLPDPYILNKLFLILFDPEPMKIYTDPPSDPVKVLERIGSTSASRGPDSLLKLRLSDMLRDRTTMEAFRLYLIRAKGPLNWLEFLVGSNTLLERVRELSSNCIAMDSESQYLFQKDFSHLQWEVWELYSNYFHQSSPEKIDFPEKIGADFKAAIEISGSNLLCNLRITEAALTPAFAHVFGLLQRGHVQKFCLSKVFYQHLVGDHAVTETDLSKSMKISPENWLTFSKFKSKVAGVFKSNIEDGSAIPAIPSQLSCEDLTVPSLHSRSSSSNSLHILETGNDIARETAGLNDEDVIDLAHMDEAAEEFVLPDFNSPLPNMTNWRVSIPRIEPRKSPQTQRTMYIYVVEVNNADVNQQNQSPASSVDGCWTVDRKYQEFYVLFDRLVKFHGENIGTSLPPKKTFDTKSRAFTESCRPQLDEFLRSLVQNPSLSGSELLRMFLSSKTEFTSNFLPTGNPFRAIRSVPSKLLRERGQHLPHFLSTFVLSTETYRLQPKQSQKDLSSSASGHANSIGSTRLTRSRSEISVASMLSGGSIGSGDMALSAALKEKLYCSIFGDNYHVIENVSRANSRSNSDRNRWQLFSLNLPSFASLPFGASLCGLYDAVLLLVHKLYCANSVVLSVLSAGRNCLQHVFDRFVASFLRKQLTLALHERRIAELTKLLEEILFHDEPTTISDSDRSEMMRLACACVKQFFDAELPAPVFALLGGHANFDSGNKMILECLQNPRLNKQLAYALLDELLFIVLPEVRETYEED